MGRVVGRVVVAHSGVGLPGVVVSILSGASDATTTPTERRPPIEIANARRLGSAITTRDGAFSIDLADTRGASADLVIVVTGPDDSDRPSENSVLYVSQVGRRSGAEEEAFLIQIAGARLEQAGLPVPERRDSAGTVIEHARRSPHFVAGPARASATSWPRSWPGGVLSTALPMRPRDASRLRHRA